MSKQMPHGKIAALPSANIPQSVKASQTPRVQLPKANLNQPLRKGL